MKFFVLMILFGISAAASNILHIGDSHSAGYFGDNLTNKFKKSDDQFVLIASCGAGVSHFLNGKYLKICNVKNSNSKKIERYQIQSFETMIEDIQPNIVSIALGSNDLGVNNAILTDKVNQLLSVVEKAKAKCVWSLAPPMPKHLDKIKVFNERLKSIIGDRCRIVDPNDKIQKMTSQDSLHFSIPSETTPWVNDVVQQIKELKLDSDNNVSLPKHQKPSTSNLQ